MVIHAVCVHVATDGSLETGDTAMGGQVDVGGHVMFAVMVVRDVLKLVVWLREGIVWIVVCTGPLNVGAGVGPWCDIFVGIESVGGGCVWSGPSSSRVWAAMSKALVVGVFVEVDRGLAEDRPARDARMLVVICFILACLR